MNNKFIATIAGTAEGIKRKRAENVATAAKLAQEALINDKRKAAQSLEARLTQLLDIGPDSADSLRPVDKAFNAELWVAQVQDVKDMLDKTIRSLRIAEGTYVEWFMSDEEKKAATPAAAS